MTESTASNMRRDLPVARSDNGPFALVPFFERSLLEWASDATSTIAAGDWRDGTVMELVGETSLLPARYDGCFEGVRETSVEFSAELVPCQGNRLNYTIWFLVAGGCGNPFRSDGYFSVTLNPPYDGHLPRWSVIRPVAALYEK